ncbi:YesL family protein [Jeotgalibaca sp. A122]|uniref:YesL family protein n=1 Tax=Jeotgalibaca sp. A122 TaxID=3457322 RepID=UPI003FCF1869
MERLNTDGQLYQIGLKMYNLMYLNILFLLSCLPIVTILPATAALFGVVRKWHGTGEISVWRDYREAFFGNWRLSLSAGSIYTIVGFLLFSNFYLLSYTSVPYKTIIYSATVFLGMLYLLGLLHLFPVITHISSSLKEALLNSLKLGIYQLHLSLACLIILAAWIMLAYHYLFIFLLFFFSGGAYGIYWFADRKFQQLQIMPS